MKFEDELEKRNPDWKKIVAAHNDALAEQREKVKTLVERVKELETRLAKYEGS